jgi:hypothetical protein
MPEANIEPDARRRAATAEEGACELVGVRTIGEALDELLAS